MNDSPTLGWMKACIY